MGGLVYPSSLLQPSRAAPPPTTSIKHLHLVHHDHPAPLRNVLYRFSVPPRHGDFVLHDRGQGQNGPRARGNSERGEPGGAAGTPPVRVLAKRGRPQGLRQRQGVRKEGIRRGEGGLRPQVLAPRASQGRSPLSVREFLRYRRRMLWWTRGVRRIFLLERRRTAENFLSNHSYRKIFSLQSRC